MKRYKLLRELPTFKTGEEFVLDDAGDLWYKTFASGIVAYGGRTLKMFPNILADWFEEIPEEPKTVWDLEEGDRYWYIDVDGYILQSYWYIDNQSEERREAGNVFLTEIEADKEFARRKVKVILERDAKGFKPDWKNTEQDEFYIVYNYITNCLDVCVTSGRYSGQILFQSMADAEASIKNHEREWKIYLGVDE